MSIEVKGINDILVMKMPEKDFEMILFDLKKLLEQPIFQQDGYYPKAFFDFGCRVLTYDELSRLIDFLLETKKVLFYGISTHIKNQSQLQLRHQQVRNGEEVYIDQETLFLGVVNPGGYVYCYENVYFLNVVRGTIVAMNEDVTIYGQQFQNAQIVINQKSLHDLTTSALSTVYYKDDEIKVVKEDAYEQNYSYNIR